MAHHTASPELAKALVANQAADVFLGFLKFFTQCPRSRIFFSNTEFHINIPPVY